VVVPPQAYVEVVRKLGYAGSYLDFMRLYLAGYGGFCTAPGQCLILPTWNHLWFLPYLWVYTLLLWALLRCDPGLLDGLARRLPVRQPPAWLLLPVVGLWGLRLALAQRFPSTHALFDDWFNHAQYLAFFLAGAVFVRLPGVWPLMVALRGPALVLALAAWALPLALALPAPVQALARSGMQWWAIVAALGFACRHLDVDHPWRAPLNEAVFTVYLLHQTVIVLGFHGLQRWSLDPRVEGVLLVGLAFGLSLSGWRLARRIAWLRPWVGLSPVPQGAAGVRRSSGR
jgi:glucan biosynthesis protein C